MPVPVMQIRIVDMRVPHRLVPVPMRMGLGYLPLMLVLVVHVMHVAVLMLQRFVRMLMVMALGQMQPKSNPHQNTGEE